MNKDEYRIYLKSGKWRSKRRFARLRAHGKCQRCGASFKHCEVHVHHVTYVHVGNELPEDLIAICKACHQFIHEKTQFDPADEEGLEESIKRHGLVANDGKVYFGEAAVLKYRSMK